MLLAGCGGGSSSSSTSSPGIVHFVPNSHAFWSNPTNWTTAFGPAYADITTGALQDDGIGAALLVAEMAAVMRTRGKTLLDELDAIYRQYGVFVSSQVN